MSRRLEDIFFRFLRRFFCCYLYYGGIIFSEEKRKRKKDKHVYDALQRINEANDERDSASVKSRESESASREINGSLLMNVDCVEYDSKDSVATMLNGKILKKIKIH